jgi:HK97 gp10 family phage protein
MPALVTMNVGPLRQKVNQIVTAKLDAVGGRMADRARQLVPVDTGQLKASIGHIVVASPMKVTVYADKRYARPVEFGTRFARAQPFLRPALKEAGAFWRASANVGVGFGTSQGTGSP